MSPVSKGGVPVRADARRNYEKLVEEAKTAFAEFGVDASLDEIARRAGVASGTLYRHFPTRLELIEAVLGERIAALVDLGRELLTVDDEFGALATWLHAAVVHGLTYRGLSAAVLNSALDDVVSTWHAEMFQVGVALVDRAQQAGVLVADADAADVLRMIGAIAWAAQDAPDGAALADRLLVLLMNGLRPTPR